MRKRATRFIFFVSCLVALCCSLLIIFRTTVVQQAFLFALPYAGLVPLQFEVRAVGGDQILFGPGEICREGVGCFFFESGAVEYSWRGLGSGQLKRILLRRFTVHLPQSKSEAAAVPEEWSDLIPARSLFFDLPVRAIELRKGEENTTPIPTALEGAVFAVEGEIRSQSDSFIAILQVLFPASGKKHEAEIRLRRDTGLSVEYRDSDEHQIALKAEEIPGDDAEKLIVALNGRVEQAAVGAMGFSSSVSLLRDGARDLKIFDGKLYGDLYGEKLPEVNFSLGLTTSSTGLLGKVSLNEPTVGISGEGEFVWAISGSGKFSFRIEELEFSSAHPFKLSSLPFVPELSLEFDRGALRGETAWRWGNEAEGSTGFHARHSFELAEVSGRYQNMIFEGLSSQGTVEHSPLSLQLEPVQVEIGQFVAGVPLEDLQFRFGFLRDPEYQLFRFVEPSGSIFGGKVVAESFAVDPNRLPFDFSVRLEGLSLGKLLEIYQLDDLEASGTLDGKLPLRVGAEGVAMTKGSLVARSPGGHLKVGERISSMLGNTPGLEVAAKALADYQYDSLEASADYQPSGLLQLQIGLKGKSPALNTTRPVNVNLSLEENILNLLKSLQIVEIVEREITRKKIGLQ